MFSDLSLAVVRCLVIMLQSFLQQGKQWPTLVAQAQVDILEILNFKKENHRALSLSLSLSLRVSTCSSSIFVYKVLRNTLRVK